MKHLLLVFIGGGIGSSLRYLLAKYLNASATGFPWGTFTANIIGSLLIGVILGLAAKNNTFHKSSFRAVKTGTAQKNTFWKSPFRVVPNVMVDVKYCDMSSNFKS